jgi:hypothetical protein
LLRLQLAFAFLATLELSRFAGFKLLNESELSENFSKPTGGVAKRAGGPRGRGRENG